MGANGLLRPARRPLDAAQRTAAPSVVFQADTITLAGSWLRATGPRRGTIVYLHGVADNRAGALGVAARFNPRGFDVVAYDSRAHGESGGTVCTYGYYEKHDLQRVLDLVGPGPFILIGSSLGAAVALQAAADDPRVTAVVAAESFSDLATAARERAPWFFTSGSVRRAFAIAEQTGRFTIEAVSPAAAASRLAIPVLLVHGTHDRETPPIHSQRIFDVLRGPRRLSLLEGAGHNQSLQASWADIERWIDEVVAPLAAADVR